MNYRFYDYFKTVKHRLVFEFDTMRPILACKGYELHIYQMRVSDKSAFNLLTSGKYNVVDVDLAVTLNLEGEYTVKSEFGDNEATFLSAADALKFVSVNGGYINTCVITVM